MAENQDFRTAYSYFYEAFENFDANEDEVNAQKALKYMCVAKVYFFHFQITEYSSSQKSYIQLFYRRKSLHFRYHSSKNFYLSLFQIMLNEEVEVRSILSSKLAAKYSGRDLDAIRTIAEALENRSLQNYYKAYIL